MRSSIFITLFFVLVFYGVAFSQDQHPIMVPGRTIDMNHPTSYADSEKFNEIFKEFYPLIKPAKSVKEQADQYLQGISRSFKMQGIDSAEAAKAALKNLDKNAFQKVYFDTYRRNLSTKELKKLMEFIQTPEGKHISEVWGNLQRATGETTTYIARTINTNLTPLREAARAKFEKEHPDQKVGQMPVARMPNKISPDLFDQNNAGSKDSMIRSQQLQNRLPKSIDSLATPHR